MHDAQARQITQTFVNIDQLHDRIIQPTDTYRKRNIRAGAFMPPQGNASASQPAKRPSMAPHAGEAVWGELENAFTYDENGLNPLSVGKCHIPR